MTSYLEQRVKEAETDGPVHEFQTGDSLHTESADLPVNINVVEARGGKYYRMWHAEDLTERLIHVNLMNNVIKQRFSVGAQLQNARPGDRVFVFDRPKARPPELRNRCRLHPDDLDREIWDAMGLPICSKPLANPYEVDRHMQKKHSTAWGTIERDRLKKERDEDRTAQKVMMDAIARQAMGGIPTIVDEAPSAPQTSRAHAECNQCSYTTRSTSKTKANNKLKKHVKDTHGDS